MQMSSRTPSSQSSSAPASSAASFSISDSISTPERDSDLAFSSCGVGERSVWGSAIMLGALFTAMASPLARTPLVASLIILGVPLLTFVISVPSRIGLGRELSLLVRGAEAGTLALLLRVVGRKKDATSVISRHTERVEGEYRVGSSRIADIASKDPLRLHHVRRLAWMASVLSVSAGLALPFLYSNTFSNGDALTAPFVIAVDALTLAVVSRLVAERICVRLLETSSLLGGGHPWAARARAIPLTSVLGAAMGAVGGLVVLTTAAIASGAESFVIFGVDPLGASLWFLRQTAPLGLPLAVAVGSVLGAGVSLAQPASSAQGDSSAEF